MAGGRTSERSECAPHCTHSKKLTRGIIDSPTMPRPRQKAMLIFIRDLIANSSSHLIRRRTVFASVLLMRSTCRRGYQLFSPLLDDLLFNPFVATFALTLVDDVSSPMIHIHHSLWKLKLSIQYNYVDLFKSMISNLFVGSSLFTHIYMNYIRIDYDIIMSWINHFRPNIAFYIEMHRVFPHYLTVRTIDDRDAVEREVYRGLSASQVRHVTNNERRIE